MKKVLLFYLKLFLIFGVMFGLIHFAIGIIVDEVFATSYIVSTSLLYGIAMTFILGTLYLLLLKVLSEKL